MHSIVVTASPLKILSTSPFAINFAARMPVGIDRKMSANHWQKPQCYCCGYLGGGANSQQQIQPVAGPGQI
jgi:hypothetical protein